MDRAPGFQHTIPDLFPKRSTGTGPRLTSVAEWEAPTFGEFVRQLEHGFGDSLDLSSLPLTRADDDETLSPHSVKSLCEVLGVPPEDFGVESD